MACNFSIPISGSVTNVLGKARTAVQNQGGIFRGDDNAGMFQVNVLGSAIRGSYTVSGQQMLVNIDSKPFLVPCSTIENFLRSQMNAEVS